MQVYANREAALQAAKGIHPKWINVYPVVSGKKVGFALEVLTRAAFKQVEDAPQEVAQPDAAPRTYKRPQKGVCADVWVWCDANQPTSAAQVRAYGVCVGWNANNCTTEYYAWRRAAMH